MPQRHQAQTTAYAFQLAVSIVLLTSVPGNLLKLVLLVCWWALTFPPLSRSEWTFFVLVNTFFVGMNWLCLRQGIFAFTHPDLLLQPCWEFPMWGYLLLNARKALGGQAPRVCPSAWWFAAAFSACFGLVSDPNALLLASGAILVVALTRFHDAGDVRYAAWFAGVGIGFEYAGVWSGLWSYPQSPLGGVPPWFLTMWAGIGLFYRRLAMPHLEDRSSAELRSCLELAIARGKGAARDIEAPKRS